MSCMTSADFYRQLSEGRLAKSSMICKVDIGGFCDSVIIYLGFFFHVFGDFFRARRVL